MSRFILRFQDQPLHCPLCLSVATREHFVKSQRCLDATASLVGITANVKRRTNPGNTTTSSVSCGHRIAMAKGRHESTLKCSFTMETVRFLGFDAAKASTGVVRNEILRRLGLMPMQSRGNNPITQRYSGSRVQLDFRITDVEELWHRFELGVAKREPLTTLTERIEQWLQAESCRPA